MGFRFRKSVKIGGIRFNFGKTGLTSMSVGKKGLTANINKRGIRTTAGIHGTGLSYSKSHNFKEQKNEFSENNRMTQATLNRPNCPHCGSIQTKYNSKQSNLSKLVYKCNNCGYQFIIEVNLEPLQKSINAQGSKKPTGFFGKLLGWIIFIIFASIIYSAFISPSTDKKPEAKSEDKSQVVDNAPLEEDPLKQEFSKEAEEAAHAYIPPVEEPQKSISDSQDQSDTLNIKTTIRKSE